MEIWEDETHLEKGINKILTGTFFTKREAHKITQSDMRAMLRRYSGSQMVSNFRPTAAATLYDIFVDKDQSTRIQKQVPCGILVWVMVVDY